MCSLIKRLNIYKGTFELAMPHTNIGQYFGINTSIFHDLVSVSVQLDEYLMFRLIKFLYQMCVFQRYFRCGNCLIKIEPMHSVVLFVNYRATAHLIL